MVIHSALAVDFFALFLFFEKKEKHPIHGFASRFLVKFAARKCRLSAYRQ